MTASRRGPSILYHIAAGAATLFILTVLAMLTTALSDPDGPLNRWLNRYGTSLILGEIALLAISTWAALTRDQSPAAQKPPPPERRG